MSSNPVIVEARLLHELGRAYVVLIDGIEAFIHEWASNPALASLIPLDPRLSRLIRDSAPRQHVSGILSPVFQISESGAVSVCDLSTRMQFADLVNTAAGEQVLLQEVHRKPHGRALVPHAPCISLLESMRNRLDARRVKTIWVVHGAVPGPRFSTCEFLPGIIIRDCHFKELSCQDSQREVLCCRLDDGAVETIPFCILELHQHELLALKDEVLGAIKHLSDDLRTFPDLHTMLLACDNRLLYALRTCTTEAQKEVKSWAEKIITPTAPASSVSPKSAWLASNSLVMRPCFSGQEKFVREKDVGSNIFHRLIDDLPDDEPRVVQPAVEPRKFECVSSQGIAITSVTGAVLPSLDGRFYGTCMLSDECMGSGLIAESCSTQPLLSCVFELETFGRSIDPHISSLDEVSEQRFKIKKTLAINGFGIVTGNRAEDFPVQKCLQDILDVEGNRGCAIHENGMARFNGRVGRFPFEMTTKDFVPKTENSFDDEPPRFVAVPSQSSWPESGGYFISFANIADAVERLDAVAVRALKTLKVKWTKPPKQGHEHIQPIFGTVLLSSSRGRLCRDGMCASNLSEKDREIFWTSFSALQDELRKGLARNKIFVDGSFVFMWDNHRYAHVCSDLFNGTFDCDKISFQFEDRPETMRALISAHEHPFYQYHNKTYFANTCANVQDAVSLQNWPLLHKKRIDPSMDAVFKDLFLGKGDLYWSGSSGSTFKKFTGKISVLPTALNEMKVMRSMLREMYEESGLVDENTVCVNLFVTGFLTRSMEVQCHLLTDARATHLPVGAVVPDNIVCDIIENYGANMIVGFGSRLAQIAIYCERTGRRLPSITRVLHGGETISDLTLERAMRCFSTDVQCFGMYGSSEAGVFALRLPGENTYSVLPDCVHCEIVDENGARAATGNFGTLVLTVLPRIIHPLIRYYTGDIARFVSPAGDRFELKGRDMISRKIGTATVSWGDVESAIQTILEDAFGVLCLYQLWLQEERDGGHSAIPKTKVTLAIYGKAIDDWENVSSLAIRSLQKVFVPENYVSHVDSVLLDNGADLRRLATKKFMLFATIP